MSITCVLEPTGLARWLVRYYAFGYLEGLVSALLEGLMSTLDIPSLEKLDPEIKKEITKVIADRFGLTEEQTEFVIKKVESDKRPDNP